MSYWEDYQIEAKVRDILQSFPNNDPYSFGHPFVSVRQIAHEFLNLYSEELRAKEELPHEFVTDENGRLTEYISHELSTRIKNKKINDIEAAFLNPMKQLPVFSYARRLPPDLGHDLSSAILMFRLRV